MASPALNFPYHLPPPPAQPHFQPPPPAAKPPPPSPPPHHFPPPPPHVIPSPPPPPPSSPSNHTTVIVIVFVSCGGLFFLAFLAAALCCFVKKRRKKTIQETEIVDVDEHLKVKEAIVQGPHGPQTVVLSVEDDLHVHEATKKREKDTYFKSICCLAAKKKKKEAKETEIANMDEHLKVKEEAVLGPGGQEAVVISVEDDVHIEEEIGKSSVDKFGHKQPSS